MAEKARKYRARMIEMAAEHDEELMEAFIHDTPADEQAISRAIRKGTLENKLNPVFVGSALKYVGIQRLLDGVVAYLPSPLGPADDPGHKPDDETKKIPVKCDPDGPLVALAFKIITDTHGDLYFLRLYQGTLKTNSRVLNPNRDKRENIMRIFEMHANERKILESARAGDIVAVVGLRHTLTGDTLCDPKKPVVLPSISFPRPSSRCPSSRDRRRTGPSWAMPWRPCGGRTRPSPTKRTQKRARRSSAAWASCTWRSSSTSWSRT